MTVFRVTAFEKTLWTKTLEDALATAQEWAVALAKHKLTGEVEVAHFFCGVKNTDKFIETLNGNLPLKRRWYVRFENGVPVEEYKQLKRHVRAKQMPVYTTVHPTPRHADWVKTMMRDISGYQDIFKRAPDGRTALIALRLAKADKSSSGYKLTLGIAEYLWQWANLCTPKRKRVR